MLSVHGFVAERGLVVCSLLFALSRPKWLQFGASLIGSRSELTVYFS